jgi:hypothetical protein
MTSSTLATSTLLATLVLPALTGLIVGFAAGIIVGAAVTLRWFTRRLYRGDSVPIYHEEDNPTPGRRPWRSKEHFSRLGWTLALLGILGFIAGVISLLQIRDVSGCLADYAQSSATSTQARAEAADIDRAADKKARDATQDSVDAIVGVLDISPDLTPDERRKILDGYKVRFARNRDALARIEQDKAHAEQIRDANPVPAQPAC